MVADRHVLTFDATGLAQAFAESGHIAGAHFGRARVEIFDYRQRLLRTRGRRRRCRAAKERDELAPVHWSNEIGGLLGVKIFSPLLLTVNGLVHCKRTLLDHLVGQHLH
jgi:hypothetical protein